MLKGCQQEFLIFEIVNEKGGFKKRITGE